MIARILAPPRADLSAVRAALSRGSIGIAGPDAPFDVLIVFGGLDVRHFIDRAEGVVGNLSPDVLDQVRSAHADGKWIGAPCVALAVVLQALEQEVASGAASQNVREDGCIIFEDLRTIGTERSLLGRSAPDIAYSLDRLTHLISHRARGKMQNATTETEHNAHH